MSNTLDTASSNLVAPLVVIEIGSTVLRYARWSSDIAIGGNTYSAKPAMAVEIGEEGFGSVDEPFAIVVQADSSLDTVSALWKQGVSVTVYECDPLAAASTVRVRTVGLVNRRIKNLGGRAGLYRLECNTPKSLLSGALGLPMLSTCNHVFASNPGCQATNVSHAGTLSVVSGARVEISGLFPPTPAHAYVRGYVERTGQVIAVRRWFVDPLFGGYILDLSQPVPASWVGQSVTIRGGCDGSIESCRLWDNEARFRGMGIKTPTHHPVFEEGG